MTTPNSDSMDDAYPRVYRRYDPAGRGWYEYDPEHKTANATDVPFKFFINHPSSSPYARNGLKVVHLCSPTLIATVKRCLPFVDNSLDYDEDEEEDEFEYDYSYYSPTRLEVDARTLVAHQDVLQTELMRLKGQVHDLEGTMLHPEAKSTSPLHSESSTDNDDESTEDQAVGTTSNEITELNKLLYCLDKEFAATKRRYKALLEKKSITYDLLWLLFRRGRVITFKDPDSDLVLAGEVTGSSYIKNSMRQYFSIVARYVDYSGKQFHYSSTTIEMRSFSSHTEIDSLRAQPLDDPKLRESLRSRGRTFVQLKGKHYLEYHDFLLVRGQFDQLLKYRAKGRAMVDASSYFKMNLQGHGYRPREAQKIAHVSEDELVLCASTVLGFSFVTKMWGRLVVDKFAPIVWNKNAFDHLVLPSGIKQLIKSLVRADRQGGAVIKDIVAGKGGGCIIVLHGRPGTGKTLTAEAVAEEQEKPLLSISVGDLGTNARDVEKSLKEILELAALWDAVLLFDEADIFMEARSLHELERNAMVGVFLKLLEYHERIMFLTTNRVTTFDEAFKSRISVAVQYKDLDESARRSVWENFLKLAGVKVLDGDWPDGSPYVTMEQLDELASKSLNGREIKNAMRTAQALANTSEQPLGCRLILDVLESVEQFDVAFNR